MIDDGATSRHQLPFLYRPRCNAQATAVAVLGVAELLQPLHDAAVPATCAARVPGTAAGAMTGLGPVDYCVAKKCTGAVVLVMR